MPDAHSSRARWLRTGDRVASAFLMLGAAGHTAGSFAAYGTQPMTLLWSLCASVLILVVGAVNILRSFRPGDAALAGIAGAATFAWFVISLAFGLLIGNPFDIRPLIFEVLSLVLLLFCGLTLMGAMRGR